MGKRKRDHNGDDANRPKLNGKVIKHAFTSSASVPHTQPSNAPLSIQIVTGSYERVLHGIIADIPQATFKSNSGGNEESQHSVSFSDSFLFNAHTSAIRCLAISPPSESHKVLLATGSTDERINIYSLSTLPPSPSSTYHHIHGSKKPSALNSILKPTSSNLANKELGTLNHHSSTVTTLTIPTRSKLLSTAADNSIAILRTRDWEPLSTLRAPIPKPAGRPSGDTAAPGEVPAGINDVAVHPSLKLMVTVGRGERCMRLWNLVTGKKAGVLQFDKGLLAQVGEGRFSSGEGRKVVWDDGEGEEYVIGFERGAVVFGMDSKPKGTILPQPLTKVHQIRYLPSSERNILLVSTEDGRILFYNANTSAPSGDVDGGTPKADALPACKLLAQLGGRQAGVGTRIKDFDVLLVSQDEDAGAQRAYIVVTACSDGAVKVWMLNAGDLESDVSSAAKQVGKLLGSYETANRITCMKAFAMSGRADSVVNGTEGGDEEDNASSSESDDSNE